MPEILPRAAGALSLFLLASCANSPAVRTELVEVPVEVQVPLPAALIADAPPPPRPAPRCTDPAAGSPTLCTEQLATWLNAYAAWGEGYRARMGEVRGLQPDSAGRN